MDRCSWLWRWGGAAAPGLWLLGCAAVEPITGGQDDRWRVPEASWVRRDGGIQVEFALSPRAPDEKAEARLSVTLHDISAFPPLPIAGADVKATAKMPRRPGHLHRLGLQALAEGAGGRYGTALVFGMGGEWLVDVRIRLPKGRLITAEFPFLVSGSEVPPWERRPR